MRLCHFSLYTSFLKKEKKNPFLKKKEKKKKNLCHVSHELFRIKRLLLRREIWNRQTIVAATMKLTVSVFKMQSSDGESLCSKFSGVTMTVKMQWSDDDTDV